METMMLAAALMNPMGLLILFLVPTIAIGFARGPVLTTGRLLRGYAAVLLVLALVVAAASYVSPERALSVWDVPAERYYSVLIREFVFNFFAVAFVAVLAMSVVSVPLLVALFKAGRATIPWLILASVVISIVIVLAASAAMSGTVISTPPTSPGTDLLKGLGLVVIAHGVLATGFGIGARLPWAMRNAAWSQQGEPGGAFISASSNIDQLK